MQSCWEILGIERTNDKLEIRKAYTKLAHTISPEEDPEGFQRIHNAFKEALRYAGSGEFPIDIPQADIPADKPADITSDKTEEAEPEQEEVPVLPFDFSSVIDPNADLPSDVKYWTELIASFKNATGIETPEDVLRWKPGTMLNRSKMLFPLYRNLYNCSHNKATWDTFFDEPLIRHVILFHNLDFSAILRDMVDKDPDEKFILDCFVEHRDTLNREAAAKAAAEEEARTRKKDKKRAKWLALDILVVVAFWFMFLLWTPMENIFALFLGIELVLAELALFLTFRFLYLTYNWDEKWTKMASTYLTERNIFLVAVYVAYMFINFKMARGYDIANLAIAFVFTCIGGAYVSFMLVKARNRF